MEVDRVHDKAAEKNKIKEATTIRKGLPSSLTVRRARRFCLGFIIVTDQVKIVAGFNGPWPPLLFSLVCLCELMSTSPFLCPAKIHMKRETKAKGPT